MGRGDGGRGQRRRRRRRRRHRRLRPPGLDARLQPERPRALPRDGDDRRLRGPPAAGPDRAGALGLGGAEQDPGLPRRLRLLRARPHHAPTRARRPAAILADVMREKALATASGPTHRLWEVKFGTHPSPRRRAGKPSARARRSRGRSRRSGPARWTSCCQDGVAARLTWADAAQRPGLVQARLGRRRPGARPAGQREQRARRTWEAPDGTIVPLDGFLDPYFQEVYLEAESLPLFARLVKELSADSVDDYVDSSSTRSGSTPSRSRTTARPRAGCTTSSG